ncbi:oligosaccharide flippase family protein [Candidatus Micrarchaeota archaeon]|nr:oligosaccharide flippase family protein [Candidatus Micrarchaeota archaeon]
MRKKLEAIFFFLAPQQQFLTLNAISIIGSIAAMGLAYIYQLIAARALSLADYGSLGVLLGIWAILTIPLGSITAVLAREMAKRSSSPQEANFIFKKYAYGGGMPSIALSLACALLLYLLNQPLLALLLLGLPASFLISIISAWLQAKEKILELSLMQCCSQILRILSLLFFLALGLGLAGAVGSVPAYITILLLVLLLVFYPQFRDSCPTQIHLRGEFMLLAALLLLQNLLLYQDLFAVKYFLPAAEAGLYNAAEVTAKILVFFAGAIGIVLYPKIAKLEGAQLAREGKMLLAISGVLLLPVFFGFLVFGQQFITLFYGEKFAAAVEPFRLLSIAMLVMGWAQLLTLFLMARKREKSLLLSYSLAVVLNTLALFTLVPLYGMAGAALGIIITSGALLLALLWHVLRLPSIHAMEQSL